MRRFATALLLALSTAALPMPAQAAPSDDLRAVIDAHWAWWLKENPVSASSLGVHEYDDQLGDISLAGQDRSASEAQKLLDRLNAIPDAGLSDAERANKGVLARLLSDQIEGNRYGQRMMLFTTYESPHQSFAGLGDYVPLFNARDYRSYLARLAKFPSLNEQVLSVTKQAIAKGYVQPCNAMGGFETTIDGAVSGAPEETRFYEPFKRARPNDVSEADWTAMKAEAVHLIRDVITPGYHQFSAFYVKDYKPKCAARVGASFLPNGKDYYAFRARAHTTTSLTPEQIHEIGLQEVSRILKRMDEVAHAAAMPTAPASSPSCAATRNITPARPKR